MKKNTHHLLSILITFLCISSAYSQNVYEIKLVDCDQNYTLVLSREKIKILTKHEIIKSEDTAIIFKTSADSIKVAYTNLYYQKMDTVFVPKKKHTNSLLYLCLDNFKDSKKETFIENAIKKKRRWKLKIIQEGCYGRFKSKIVIINKKNKILAKYSDTEYNPKSKRRERVIKYRILSKIQLEDAIRFEKKLRLLGDGLKAEYGDITGTFSTYMYTIQTGNKKKKLKTTLTSKTIDEHDLLDRLGFKK